MRTCVVLVLFFASTVVALAVLQVENPASVPYPEGYRKWAHVKSGIIGPANPAYKRYGGLHHIYANEEALRGFQAGQFPEGSVIVFDLFSIATTDDVTIETERRHIDVMHKDSKRFSETGGWGFEEFRGDSRDRDAEAPAPTVCFKCHSQQKGHDSVFSSLRK